MSHFGNILECKQCWSNDVVKNGYVKGKQVYLCNDCGARFSNLDSPYRMRIKYAVFHYILLWANLGYSLRKIQRGLSIFHSKKLSHVAIWKILQKCKNVAIKEYGKNRYLLEYQIENDTTEYVVINNFGQQIDEPFPLRFQLTS